jgi:transcriptional regulator with XRE-family HTH domain
LSDNIDEYVGLRLREKRVLLGMSQEVLAKSCGVTFQQIQKYEKGSNRIGCSRLYDFQRILGVTANYFFEGIEDIGVMPVAGENEQAFEYDSMPMTKETLSLVKAFNTLSDPKVRRSILALIRSLGGADNDAPSEEVAA